MYFYRKIRYKAPDWYLADNMGSNFILISSM